MTLVVFTPDGFFLFVFLVHCNLVAWTEQQKEHEEH